MSRYALATVQEDFPEAAATTILSSSSDIAHLASAVDRLMPGRDVALTPSFMLASLADNWLPRVAVVRRRGTVIGVVYGKERTIAGFSTGLIYADGRLGTLAVARPEDMEEVTVAAVDAWFALPRMRGVRLAIAPEGAEARALNRAYASMRFDHAESPAPPNELHSRLVLPRTYEAFLETLGKRTRRNFRYYRRRFEAAGHRYVEQLSHDDFESAALELRTKCHIASSVAEIKRAVRTVDATGREWIAGLRHANGQWLSVAAGWSARDRATMFLQLNNDREFSDASLSVVLRAFLIETFINEGMSELAFWSGSAPPLSRYVEPMPAIAVHLDAPTIAWRFVRGVIGTTEPFIGRWITADVRWMVGGRSPQPHDAEAESSPPA